MQHREFVSIIDAQINRSRDLLLSKNANYNENTDAIQSFKTAAALQQLSLTEAASGMMAKHIVSIFDMCASSKIYPYEVWDEKIGDAVNYLLILRALVEEMYKALPTEGPKENHTEQSE